MAYSYGQQGYPYQNPYMAQYQQAPFTPPAPKYRGEVVKVNGKNGADAFQMEPNSSTLLMDETAPIVWLKITDGAGYATCTPYSIAPYQPEAPVDVKALEGRITRLEEALGVSQSNDGATVQAKPAGQSA